MKRLKIILDGRRRLSSFSNPVLFKTQALRFSTHGIPRFISLSQIEQGYLSLPSGCLDDVLALLSERSVTAIGLIQKRKVSTLILVHSRALLDQCVDLRLKLTRVAFPTIAAKNARKRGKTGPKLWQNCLKCGELELEKTNKNMKIGQLEAVDFNQLVADLLNYQV